MAEHEEQVDWEDGDDSGDFWRGAEPVATVAASQQPVVAEEDDDDVISLLGDNPATPVVAEIPTQAPQVPQRQSTPPSSPLPPGWSSFMSRTHNRKYYTHNETNERRWDRPPMTAPAGAAAVPMTPPLSPAVSAPATQTQSIHTGTSAVKAPASNEVVASAYANRLARPPPSGPKVSQGKRRDGSDGKPNELSHRDERDPKRVKTQEASDRPTQTTNHRPTSPRLSKPPPAGPSDVRRDQRDYAFKQAQGERQGPPRSTDQPPPRAPRSATQPRPPPAVRGANTAPMVNSRWGAKPVTPTGPSQPAKTSAPPTSSTQQAKTSAPPTSSTSTGPAPAQSRAPPTITASSAPIDTEAAVAKALEEGIRLGIERERQRQALEEANAVKARAEAQAAERRRAIELKEEEERAEAAKANRWGTRGARLPPPAVPGVPQPPVLPEISRRPDGPSRPAPVDSRDSRGPPADRERERERDSGFRPADQREAGYRRDPGFRPLPDRQDAGYRPPLDRQDSAHRQPIEVASRPPVDHRDSNPRLPPARSQPPYDSYRPVAPPDLARRERERSPARLQPPYDSHRPVAPPDLARSERERSPPRAGWSRPPPRSSSPISDPRFTRRVSPPRRGVDRFPPVNGPSPRPVRSLQDRIEPRSAIVAEPMSRRPEPPRPYSNGRASPVRPPLASRMSFDDRPSAGYENGGPNRRGRGGGGVGRR